jgi:hypothetical protein
MNAAGDDRERLEGQAVECLMDPVAFAQTFLQQDLWATQEAILRSVATRPRTAVKACHASGKTMVAALAALWWVTRFDDGIVVTTAPTWTQVELLLWGEIHKAIASARIAYPKANTTELKLGPGNYAIGLSTNEGVRFQGFHGNHILVILDEAPGVKPDIWEAIEGARAGGDVRILALGNPTIASGPFHDAFTDNRDGWAPFTIGAFDTPNLAGLTLEDILGMPEEALDTNVRPYLTTRRWVKEKHSEWGPGHPLWEARVLGSFPAQSEDALISLAWLEAAQARDITDGGGPLDAGIDVAGPGEDETVLDLVEGPRVLLERAWPNQDPRGEIVATLTPFKPRLRSVKVDSAGIGYYLARHLEDLGFPVEFINVGEAPRNSERYKNLKAELYDGLRQRFKDGAVSGVGSQRAVSQLAGLRYRHNARGQMEIESKEEAQKRGVKSPDRAEAMMLAFATTDHGLMGWLDAKVAAQAPKEDAVA